MTILEINHVCDGWDVVVEDSGNRRVLHFTSEPTSDDVRQTWESVVAVEVVTPPLAMEERVLSLEEENAALKMENVALKTESVELRMRLVEIEPVVEPMIEPSGIKG